MATGLRASLRPLFVCLAVIGFGGWALSWLYAGWSFEHRGIYLYLGVLGLGLELLRLRDKELVEILGVITLSGTLLYLGYQLEWPLLVRSFLVILTGGGMLMFLGCLVGKWLGENMPSCEQTWQENGIHSDLLSERGEL